MSTKQLIMSFCVCLCFTVYGQQDTIVKSGHKWRYHHDTKQPTEEWLHDSVFIQNMQHGTSPFEYDEHNFREKYNITEKANIYSYYTTSFYIESPLDILAYELRIRRDDGAVIYINGHEIHRSNVGSGNIQNITNALDDIDRDEENIYHKVILNPEYFDNGINTISVVIFQWKENDIDHTFDLEIVEHNDVAIVPELLKHIEEETSSITMRMKEMSLLEKINEAENSRDLYIQSNSQNIILRNIFLVLFLFLLSFVVYLLYQKKIISKSHNLLVKETMELRKEALNNSINNIKVHHFLEKTISNIEKSIQKQSFAMLTPVINDINQKTSNQDNWEEFELQFNLLNSGFINQLKKAYPTLTKTELRHCIFIKSLLPAKEVASLMGVELRTVQSSWYRIKKKMKLSSNTDLKDFLAGF